MTGDCVTQPHAVVTLSVTFSLQGLLSRAHDNAQNTGTYTRVPSAAHQTLAACVWASLGGHVPAPGATRHIPPSPLPAWEPV